MLGYRIGPTVTVRGRLIDKSGHGVENVLVRVTFRVYQGGPLGFPSGEVAAQAQTDAAGDFELPSLVMGEKYTVSASHRDDGIYLYLKSFTPDRSGIMDLGDLTEPLTLETIRFFMPRGKLSDRIAAALDAAKPRGTRVLLTVGDPKDPVSKKLVEWRDRHLTEWSAYRTVAVSTEDEEGVTEINELYGVELSELRLPAWLVLDENGEVLAAHSLHGDLATEHESFNWLPFLLKHAAPRRDSQ